ncbi:MAG: 5-formyltetrahydrofolate cyclo-ligase [archaeon]|nr:5-formyltetrahydrofolate cyclo-ligase [archaeon]
MSIFQEKELLRKTIYDKLFYGGFSNRPKGDYGKIPNFKGSELAAKILANTSEWKNAKTIFSSPDSAQIPVRYLALKEGKNLIMASPNLNHGYLFLYGQEICNFSVDVIEEASTKEGAFKYCIDVEDFPKIDFVVEGSVAVDKLGNRIGKGKGFADMEIADLFKRNLISSKTVISTTIHPLQLVDYVPTENHDMKLNMIATSDDVFRVD